MDAAAVDAFLTSSTVRLSGTDKPTLLVNTGIASGTVMVAQAHDRLSAATHRWISTEVQLAFTGGCVPFSSADSVQAALEMITGVLAHWLAEAVWVAGEVTRAVPIPVGTGVRVATALAIRIANKTICADTLIATGHVDALGRSVAWVGVAVVNFFTPNQGVTSVARTAVADALMILGHASSIDSTAIHTRIFAVKVRETGLRDVAIFIFETFDLLAAFPLIIRVADIEAVRTCALGKVIVDNTHSSRCTLEELAAILAPPLSICFVKLADFIGMWTVSMINALWFWDLLTTPSAVGVSSKTFST